MTLSKIRLLRIIREKKRNGRYAPRYPTFDSQHGKTRKCQIQEIERFQCLQLDLGHTKQSAEKVLYEHALYSVILS